MPHVTEEIWSNLPAREARLIVSPWPEPQERWAADADALVPAQDAARIFRRSGIRVPLEGEVQRVFETVVKPERAAANGNVEAEIARLRAEVERGRKKLANERFVERAAPEVVDAEREKLARYERELDALGG